MNLLSCSHILLQQDVKNEAEAYMLKELSFLNGKRKPPNWLLKILIQNSLNNLASTKFVAGKQTKSLVFQHGIPY